MAESELKHLWLHDENKTTTIAPKVVIDDIQMDDSESSELFKENYDDFKTDYAGYKVAVAGTVARIDTEIDNLKQTATPSSNGLMSKEDKIKLDGLRNYELPRATTTKLGGVRIDDDTIKIDSNGVISATQKIQNLEDLENVSINNLSDNNFLIYDQTNNEWKNSDTLDLSLELEQLSNVRTVELSNQDVLMYDNNNHIWTNRKFAGGEAIGIEEINSFFNTDYNGNNTYGNKVLKEGGLHYLIDEMKDEVTEIIHDPATSTSLGSIMVGDTLNITETGVLNYNLPTASENTLGGVKIDNSTIKITNGVISSSSEIDDEAGTSATDKTWSAAKITQAISAGAGGEGTITSISAGAGLTTSDGDPITSSGTIKTKLKSETASALSSAAMGSTTDRQYAVGVDADGYLSVNVPWTDTQGEGSSVESLSDKILLSKNGILNGVSFYVNTVQYTENGANLTFTFSSGGSLTINGTKSSSDLYLLIGKYRNNTAISSVPQLVNINLSSLSSLYVHQDDILTGCIEDSGINVYLNYYHNLDNPQYDALDDGEIKDQNTVHLRTNSLVYNIVLKLTNTSYDNITIQPAILQDKMPIASTTYPGIVMIDGNTITMDNNIIKANFPSLTPATSSDLGGIKVGDNLLIDTVINRGTLTANPLKVTKYLAEGVEATNGKINLFEIDRYYRKVIEQDNGTDYSFSNNGISITINSDYSITINGTAVQDKYISLGYYFDSKNNHNCYYTDNLDGETSLDTFTFVIRMWDTYDEEYKYFRPTNSFTDPNHSNITSTTLYDNLIPIYACGISDESIPEGYEISELYLAIKAGTTVTDITCYPMALHLGYLGVTEYHPPRAFYTNRELYNKIVDFSNKMNFLMQDCVSNNAYYPLPIGYLDPNLTVDSNPYTHTITLNGTIPSGSYDSGDIDIGYIKMNHPFKHTLLIVDRKYIPENCSLVLSNSNHGSYTISYSDIVSHDAFDLMHEYDYQESLDKIPYTYQNAYIYAIDRNWETENIGVSLRIDKNSDSSSTVYNHDFFRIDVMVYDEGFDPNGYLNYQNGYKINVNLQNEVSELTSALLNLQSRVAELENNINSNNNT